jgi:hypothetical protein
MNRSIGKATTLRVGKSGVRIHSLERAATGAGTVYFYIKPTLARLLQRESFSLCVVLLFKTKS